MRSDFAAVPGSGAWIAGLKGDVQRAGGTGTGAFDDMEVDHGGGDVGVAEEVLNRADVSAVLEQLGGKTVAQGVRGDAFGNAAFLSGLAKLPGHGILV